MSIQLNIFYGKSDLVFVYYVLQKILNGFCVVGDRGTKSELVVKKVRSFDDFQKIATNGKIHLLLESDIVKLQYREIGQNQYRIDSANCPVVEFIPSRIVDDEVLKIGRFYYPYTGDDKLKKHVQSIFKLIKKGAKQMPSSKGFWYLEGVEKIEKIVYWAGNPELNPVFSSC